MLRESLEREAHTTKSGQAVLVGGMKDGENVHYAHIVGVEDKNGFNPLYINYDPPSQSMMQALKQGHDFYENHAETKEAYVARGDDGSDLPPKYAILKRPTYMVRVRIEDAPNLQPVNMPDATKQYHSRMNKEGMIYDEELGSFQPMENYDLSKAVMDAEVTKRASTGMIVRDGDPSSPPSDIFMAEDHPEYGPSAIDYQGPEHYEIVLRKTSTPMSNGEYGFCLTKALTPRLDWNALESGRPRLFMDDDFIMYHRGENLKGRIYDDEIRTYRPMNAAEKRLYEGALTDYQDLEGPWSVRLEEYTHFQAEDPTQADASNLGGPTAPGNAGVPADVGGDDLVPYDSPSAPPAGVFMNAEYKTYESRPVRNALFGVAFAVSGLYFWSTAGSVVKNWVVVRVEKYAPKLLEPQFQTMLTLTAFFGIIYFGMKLRSSSKGLTIPSMIDLPLESAAVDA
jgi:hypothetical protein